MYKPLDQELLRIRAAGTERRIAYSRSRGGGRVDLAGKSLIDFASFDYLGLSANKRIAKAAQRAMQVHGVSQSASRTGGGTLPELFAAEQRLARFFGVESALFFSSRNQALLSAMSALVSEGDVVAFEEGIQAPLVDACLLLDGSAYTFSSERLETIDPVLDKASYLPTCVFAEGLSSITGEIFPFERLSKKVSGDKKLHLIVDESYSLGALGNRGSGAYEQASVVFPHVSFVGALGFGCPGLGGYVAGDGVLIDFLKQTSRAFDVEPPLPSFLAAAVDESLDVLELQLLERQRICQQARIFRDQLQMADIGVVGGLGSPIVGVSVPSFKVGRELVSRFEAKGFLVELVGIRSIRKESPILRVVFNSFHMQSEIDALRTLIVESLSHIS